MHCKTFNALKSKDFFVHAALAHVLNEDRGQPSRMMFAGISTMDFRSNGADRTAFGDAPADRWDRSRGGRSISRRRH
jgi:hypothetical protein